MVAIKTVLQPYWLCCRLLPVRRWYVLREILFSYWGWMICRTPW